MPDAGSADQLQERVPYVGRPLRRREDARLLTGRGRYVDDIAPRDLCWAAVLRSPHAHARLRRVDTAKAAALPGVLLVLTASDVAGAIGPIRPNWVMPGSKVPEQLVLAADTVRYVGDRVAFVVAETQAAALDAMERIEVEFEPMPSVVDEEAALADGAPQLHENVPRNLAYLHKSGGGDYAKAAAEADTIVRLRIENNRLVPTCLEPRSIVADPSPADGALTLYIGSQIPHMTRRFVAETIGLPEHRLRVVAPDIGGGFGPKMHLYAEELLCAHAALRLGRPVKWTEGRSESHVATTHGRAHVEHIELAVMRDGRILGMKLTSYANVGAYLSNMATGIPTVNCANFATGTYRIPALAATVYVMLTNTVPVDAYRGAGRPEAAYIAERSIEAVARHLKLDPVEVRRVNFVRPEDFPYHPYGSPRLAWDSGNYQACLDTALAMIGHDRWRARQEELRQAGRHVGVGVAAYTELCGMGPSRLLGAIGFDRGGWESARLSVGAGGKVTVFSGSMPQGQGHATSLAQIAADALQLPIDDIDVVQGDTAQVQAGHGTFNSRSMAVGGSAVRVCADKIIAKATAIAAGVLEVAETDIVYRHGAFIVPGTDLGPVTFRDVARRAYVAHSLPAGLAPGLDETLFHDPTMLSAPSGVHAVVAEVDVETGEVTLLDYVAVDDAGRIINPLLAEGQIHGGVVQGIGQALYEGAVYDRVTGQLLSGSLLDYAIPRADQVPALRTAFHETPSPTNPLGVKGIGEAGTIGAPPAVVAAVLDALAPFGIDHLDMPLTPQRVWRALQAKRA
ncbi:carbon-monoxide dehydrogenase large subunit [Enhydrobacter aerosaccus]|uniref:Carbon-monoxide dehydrogenase large subunit n=1 Tax=Enhydrobacter aerosaccus TaxID=225324 RepID=A0A1T4TM43_9HYPH|nr:xanthine dehydrogenase family protein molybdopterin-binding subunit [Enhydrobacter aerosaccus]SKA41545.1 carbon-monoxide dehydrogenase large subunit [Enhydrobacter aerosaccus]